MAGVSVATVSRVIHNSGTVNEDTRKRVEAAVRRLGYQRAARRAQPRQRRAEKIVLLMTGDIVNPSSLR
jgi:LacI family transcriptional regulator